MRQIALIAFVLCWFGNSVVLGKFYDVTVYDEYLAFWRTRGILYDGMFLSMSVILFYTWRGFLKAGACFMVIITAGSFIDKALYRVVDYMYSDIVLVILGIIVSIIVYGRDRKRSSEFTG